jgi:hypothetical protein
MLEYPKYRISLHVPKTSSTLVTAVLVAGTDAQGGGDLFGVFREDGLPCCCDWPTSA